MAAYIPGYINSMDVLGFGFTTQSAMFWQSQHAALDVHENVQCDGCGASPLRGIRWRCQSCPDHDICNNCKKQGQFPGHSFQIMSMTSTNNANAIASGGQVVPEALVHWTKCQNCNVYPIRGTLYACTVCPNFDLCDACNKDRYLNHPDAHPHRFDFHVMPRACNPPPDTIGGARPQQAVSSTVSTQQYQQYQIPQQQQQPGHQQQGFAPPPQPYYEEQQSTTGRILNWLNRHVEYE